MKKIYPFLALVLVTTLTGCELIGDIFQAGVSVGIFIVVAIIVLVFWILSRIRR